MTRLLDHDNKDAKNVRLSVPWHVKWAFNKEYFSEISNVIGSSFEFTYTFSETDLPTSDLKYAIRKTLTDLYTKGGMPLSICISGADSEIIAREAAELGIPFELYFLDIWDINAKARQLAQRLAIEIGAKLNIVSLSKEEAFDTVLEKNYRNLQAEKPTYLCLPYLLEKIPFDTYIIGGEGDPQKSGVDYEPLANSDGTYNGIPISITEVYYRQWALINHRACEMYFYASTPLLLKSFFHHPLMVKKNNRIDTRELVNTLWPNLTFSYKTTNWEDSVESNYEVRMHMRSLNKNQYRNLPMACLVDI
jgi:hypothetical protein